MTSYNAIRGAIIAKLHGKYPAANVHGVEIQQGYTRPAFYVQLIPEASQELNTYHQQKPFLIDIHYFSSAAANARTRDMWAVADDLDALFGACLNVEDRSIHIGEKHPEIDEGVLHYQFNINYIDSLDEDKVLGYQAYDKMATLIMGEEL